MTNCQLVNIAALVCFWLIMSQQLFTVQDLFQIVNVFDLLTKLNQLLNSTLE